MKNANTPANPTTAKVSNTNEAWSYQVGDDMLFQFPGITKREMFAMAAMQALITRGDNLDGKITAVYAVRYADELLDILEK